MCVSVCPNQSVAKCVNRSNKYTYFFLLLHKWHGYHRVYVRTFYRASSFCSISMNECVRQKNSSKLQCNCWTPKPTRPGSIYTDRDFRVFRSRPKCAHTVILTHLHRTLKGELNVKPDGGTWADDQLQQPANIRKRWAANIRIYILQCVQINTFIYIYTVTTRIWG